MAEKSPDASSDARPSSKWRRNVERLPARTWDSLYRNVTRLPVRTWDSLRRRTMRPIWRLGVSLRKLPWKILVRNYWMRLGDLDHYPPQPIRHEDFPLPELPSDELPSIAIVTPSYGQAAFIGATVDSVAGQDYPHLQYRVRDGASTDGTVEILQGRAAKLTSWVSEPDEGQADAVCKGLSEIDGDIMAWLNSDDLLMPGALRFVGEYFAKHPEVDVIYGHRVLIDDQGQEIGRWVLPDHRNEELQFVDFVPQETLFWRKELYEQVGGVNPSFYFALDWDLLLRFMQAEAKIVRVPYFLGCFRVHPQQKTSAEIGSRGREEMEQLQQREHGRELSQDEINAVAHRIQMRAAITSRLLTLGVRK